jgi:hypothetical protein
VHRSFSSRAVFVDADYTAKVGDICDSVDSLASWEQRYAQLKWMGTFCVIACEEATRAISAPEWMHNEMTTSSNVWAFGLLVVETLARASPFAHLDPTQVRAWCLFA